MDQIKIGKFIAERRKNNNLTQMQLAEKLNITDRAISKWENGKSLPDASIMLELCNELKITVNDLLSGEMINMEDYQKKAEDLLLEMAQKEETQNKKLLYAMYVLIIASLVFYFAILLITGFLIPEGPTQLAIIIISTVIFMVVAFFALKLEVEAGYYECKKCHNKFVPSYKEVVKAMHMGTKRYLRCPKCNEKSWCKKRMSK